MKYTVSKTFSFEAAHSLPFLPEGHKCRNVHGHSYVIEVFFAGPVDARGFVVDYAEISEAMKPIIKELDHKNLNEVIPFATTAENLALWILDKLANSATVGRFLVAADVHETARTCVRVER